MRKTFGDSEFTSRRQQPEGHGRFGVVALMGLDQSSMEESAAALDRFAGFPNHLHLVQERRGLRKIDAEFDVHVLLQPKNQSRLPEEELVGVLFAQLSQCLETGVNSLCSLQRFEIKASCHTADSAALTLADAGGDHVTALYFLHRKLRDECDELNQRL